MRQSNFYWREKLRSRRPQDFNDFFDHFFPRLYRFTLARVRDPQLAEEAVQEAMSIAILKIDSYLGEAALFSWLCTITRHEMSRILKRESKHAATLAPWDDEATMAALESLEDVIAADPDKQLEKRQLADTVHLAMASLPKHYADILESRYLQGHTIADIARQLNKTYKATESLLSRSRECFKDAFLANIGSTPESAGSGGE